MYDKQIWDVRKPDQTNRSQQNRQSNWDKMNKKIYIHNVVRLKQVDSFKREIIEQEGIIDGAISR